MSETIVIASAARTPMGGFQGSLGDVSAPELGSVAIKAALERAGVAADQVDEVLFGCVLPAGVGQAPARQAALGSGLPLGTPCTTINKVCGSGMKTIMQAYDQIKAGSNSIVVAGGMESMSQAPYMLAKARGGYRMGHGEVTDHMFYDGLQDAESGGLMGAFAQGTADKLKLTREQMDNFAITSLKRAQKAIDDGSFKTEIAPVTVKTRKGETVVEIDEQPGNANIEKIPQLRPAFAKDGTVTAANSSSISDGASAVLVMSESAAKEHNVKPLAKIVAHSSHAQLPAEFTIAPIGAVKKLMEKTGWSKDDVDLFEINEAFAMVTLAAMQELGLDHDKVNIHGGACALGHPLGSSGSRIVVTLLHALQKMNKTRGIASLCIGGGEATALAVELL